MPKVHLYLRFSSQIQAHGTSRERQLSNWRSFIKTHDYTEGLIFKDEARSAFDATKERPALDRLLKSINDGTISSSDFVYVELLDRLSRASVMPALNLLTSILQTGVSIATGQQTFTNDDDISSAILATIELGRAHSESAAKQKRQLANLDTKSALLDQGIPAKVRVPTWITYEAKPEPKYVANEFSKTVKTMFELFLKGHSIRSICRRLNESDEHQSVTGSGFSPSAVRRYLTAIEVTGLFGFRGKTYPVLPAIVDTESYWAAQSVLKANKSTNGGHKREPSSGKRSLFRNVKCGNCGGYMRHIQKTSKSNARLRCGQSSNGRCPIKRPVPYDLFERTILRHLISIDFSPSDGSDEGHSSISELTTSIQGIETQVIQATELLPSMTNPMPLVERINSLEEQKSELQRHLDGLLEQANAVPDASTISSFDVAAIADADNEERMRIASIISRTVQRITCEPTGDRDWTFYIDATGGIKHICSFDDHTPVTLEPHQLGEPVDELE